MPGRLVPGLLGLLFPLTGCVNMLGNTDTPATATAVLYNGRQVQILVAHAPGGALQTAQFRETRADLGETEKLRDLSWEKQVPAGVPLILPESGHLLEKIEDFWVAWLADSSLHAIARTAAKPVTVALAAGERLIDRPIVVLSKELHVFTWKGRTLTKHRLRPSGETVTESLLELDYDVLHSRTAPVPANDDDATLVGAVGMKDGKLVASALYVRGPKALRVDAVHADNWRPMPAQSIGVHAGTAIRPAIALVARDAAGKYALLEAVFEYQKRESGWSETVFQSLQPDQLKSAAVFYYKTQDSPEPFAVAVDTKNRVIQPRNARHQIVRRDAGDGYTFPIVTTNASRYEVIGTSQLNTF